MYLLLDQVLTGNQRRWLDVNAIRINIRSWVHNAEVSGAVAIKLSQQQLRGLSIIIDDVATSGLIKIEGMIKRNALKGRGKQTAINRLRLFESVSSDMEVVGFARDLLAILEEQEIEDEQPTETLAKTAGSLGIDKNSVESYLLALAKRKPLH